MRTIVITGATGSIGSEIARALSRQKVPLTLACRNMARGEELRRELIGDNAGTEVNLVELDLADDRSIRSAAREIMALRPFALVNNAGTMFRDFHRSAEGIEMTLTVNYYNTRLLTELLIPELPRGGAIVFTTSLMRHTLRSDHLPGNVTETEFGQLSTYALSKKLLTRYAASLHNRLRDRGIRVNCADPGVVDSGIITMGRWFDPLADILFRPFIRRPSSGAIPALRALAAPPERSGRIYTLRRDHRLQ